MRKIRWTLVTLAGLVLLTVVATLAGCGRGGSSDPNVIIIVMDTMRADRLGCYGYHRPTSPSIDAFAASSTFYTHAFATAPWTLPTHGSLFTGKLPFEHGAHTYKDDRGEVAEAPLHDSHLTLAEVFRDEGYRTGAFVANDGYLSERFGFTQGFETYHVERVYADVLNQRIASWLESGRGKPFFLWINYIDTHRVYNTRPRPGFLPEPAVVDQGQLLDRLLAAAMPADRPVPEELVRQISDQYDTAVANLDEEIGKLLAFLQDRGMYDDTIIVLTGDHGEYLGEHHLVEHSKDVYEEAMRSPLVVKGLGQREGARVERPTSLADVPSLLFAQMPPTFAADRRDHFPRDPERDPLIAENYYTRSKDLGDPRWGHRFDRVRTVLYEWPYKYIRSSDGHSELYRLDVDPREQDDLIDAEAARAEAMAERLDAFEQSRGRFDQAPDDTPLTPAEVKRLRSLGYIGD